MNFKDTLALWYQLRPIRPYSDFEKLNQVQLDNFKAVAVKFFQENLNSTYKTGKLSYVQMAEVMECTIPRFNYTSDDTKYNVADYWSTKTLLELLYTGTLRDDCDGRGREFEGILYYLCNYHKKDLYEASCSAETGEGHYVCWARADDGLIYQLENRIRKPRTIKYMLELGYTYWDYRPLTKIGKWFKADNFIGKELYKYTQAKRLEADTPEFTIKKALMVDKSKTLLKDWLGVISGLAIDIREALLYNSNDVINTLNANKADIAHYVPDYTIGTFIVILSMVGIYLRTVTNKDVEVKKDYDE